MRRTIRFAIAVLAALALLAAGYAAGQNTYGKPATIVHVSLIKWKEGATDAQKRKALEGVEEMARQIPGIKNVWLKAVRMQPRDYHDAFVIEFADRAAANRYAEAPVHEKWSEYFLSIREASISPQISN